MLLFHRTKQGITQSESIMLDAIRTCAALMVFASHWTTYAGKEQKLHAIYTLGFPGVLIFFILSGYVIAAVTSEKETTVRQYAVARLARLYSVAVPVLLLLPLLDAAMSFYDVQVVRQMSETSHPFLRILVSLCFANWWWFAQIVPFTDGPYWSLSFEAAYYVLWGAYLFGGKWRWPGMILAGLIAGPKILLMFPVWLAGAALYKSGFRFTKTGAMLALPIALICIALGRFYNILDPGIWVEEASFPTHWLRGIGFCIAIASALALSSFHKRGIIGWLADRSFTIYLLHYPLLKYLSVLMGGWSKTSLGGIVLAGSVLATCLVVGSFIEPTRLWWRQVLGRTLDRAQSAWVRA